MEFYLQRLTYTALQALNSPSPDSTVEMQNTFFSMASGCHLQQAGVLSDITCFCSEEDECYWGSPGPVDTLGGECFIMPGAGTWREEMCKRRLGYPIRDDEEGSVAKELLWLLKGLVYCTLYQFKKAPLLYIFRVYFI